MKRFLAFLIIGSSLFTVQAQQDKRLKGLEKELNTVLETWNAAGFAVAVVEKNKVIYAKGFGYRDYENKIPVTPNTLFAIGSCSKAFTTSVLGILESEGKLSLDDSPSKFVPELRFFNNEMNNSIIIKDLMAHRTGLPRHDFSWYFFPSDSKMDLVKRIAYQEPFTGVRQTWYYNNFMFLLQGVIAEEITGVSWEENVREKIFKPLNMNRSNFTIEEWLKEEDRAVGYALDKGNTIKKIDYYDIAGMSPAGSINSSVNEMANWLRTWIYGGKFNGKEILPNAFTNQASSSQMVVGSGYPDKETPGLYFANYGYGWFLSSYKGHYRVEHGGNIDGFSASTSFYPSDSLGIVVLTNQNGSSIPSVVRNIISDRMLGVDQTDWNKMLKERRDKAMEQQKEVNANKNSNRAENTKPSHKLADYTGNYNHPGYGTFKVMAENDSLFAQFTRKKLWLRHYHYEVFEPFEVTDEGIDTTENSPLKINFLISPSGEVSGAEIPLEASLDPFVFNRSDVEVELASEVLKKYVGEYQLGGVTPKVYLKGESTLYLFMPGQPEYELVPNGEHTFSIKILSGYKVQFIENEDKTITEMLFIQPNGTFKATKKH